MLHYVNICTWFSKYPCLFISVYLFIGKTVGRVVKALDSQPRDRGLESRRTLSPLYLESLGKICTRNVLRFTQPQKRTWQHTEKAIVHSIWSPVAPCSVYTGCMFRWWVEKVLVCTSVPGVIICKALWDRSRIKRYIRTAYYYYKVLPTLLLSQPK